MTTKIKNTFFILLIFLLVSCNHHNNNKESSCVLIFSPENSNVMEKSLLFDSATTSSIHELYFDVQKKTTLGHPPFKAV